MSSAFKTLKTSDITTFPYKVGKLSTFQDPEFGKNGIYVYTGINTLPSPSGGLSQEALNYRSIRQLYYSQFLSSISPQTPYSQQTYDQLLQDEDAKVEVPNNLAYYNYVQSTAASGTLELDNRFNFPTAEGAEIKILSIPQALYGEAVKPTSFRLTDNTTYDIVDDGNGNLVDQFTSCSLYILYSGKLNEYEYLDCTTGQITTEVVDDYMPNKERCINNAYGVNIIGGLSPNYALIGPCSRKHVGNIIYAHGIAVVTDPNYISRINVLPHRRCTFSGGPGGGPGGFSIDDNMNDLPTFGLPYIYELLDFTVDGVQYASNQILSITSVSQIVFGTGLDSNTYLMNISDWMNTIGVPGFEFHDNMRVIDTPASTTTYTIHIRRLGPGGGPNDYYYTQNGFSLFTISNRYGLYSCTSL